VPPAPLGPPPCPLAPSQTAPALRPTPHTRRAHARAPAEARSALPPPTRAGPRAPRAPAGARSAAPRRTALIVAQAAQIARRAAAPRRGGRSLSAAPASLRLPRGPAPPFPRGSAPRPALRQGGCAARAPAGAAGPPRPAADPGAWRAPRCPPLSFQCPACKQCKWGGPPDVLNPLNPRFKRRGSRGRGAAGSSHV
jgi:hypothetical protein